MRHLVILAFFLIGINGCGTQPSKNKLHTPSASESASWKASIQKLTALQTYDAIGKVAFNSGSKGGNAGINWQQRKERYTIELQTPLNSGTIRIVGQPNLVTLMQPDGKLVVNKTPEGLMQQTFGFDIPISGLSYWIKGIPAPGTAPTRIMFNDAKQLGLLEQHGWTIEYQSYLTERGLNLPSSITLVNGKVKLKFLFKQWNFSGISAASDSNASASDAPDASNTSDSNTSKENSKASNDSADASESSSTSKENSKSSASKSSTTSEASNDTATNSSDS